MPVINDFGGFTHIIGRDLSIEADSPPALSHDTVQSKYFTDSGRPCLINDGVHGWESAGKLQVSQSNSSLSMYPSSRQATAGHKRKLGDIEVDMRAGSSQTMASNARQRGTVITPTDHSGTVPISSHRTSTRQTSGTKVYRKPKSGMSGPYDHLFQNKDRSDWNNGTDLQYTSALEAKAKARLPSFLGAKVPTRTFYATEADNSKGKSSRGEKFESPHQHDTTISIEDDDEDEFQDTSFSGQPNVDTAPARAATRPRSAVRQKAQQSTQHSRPARAESDASEDSMLMPSSKPALKMISKMTSRRETADVNPFASANGKRRAARLLHLPLASLQLGPTLLHGGITMSISPDGRDVEISITGKANCFLRFTSAEVHKLAIPKAPSLNCYKLILDEKVPDLRHLWIGHPTEDVPIFLVADTEDPSTLKGVADAFHQMAQSTSYRGAPLEAWDYNAFSANRTLEDSANGHWKLTAKARDIFGKALSGSEGVDREVSSSSRVVNGAENIPSMVPRESEGVDVAKTHARGVVQVKRRAEVKTREPERKFELQEVERRPERAGCGSSSTSATAVRIRRVPLANRTRTTRASAAQCPEIDEPMDIAAKPRYRTSNPEEIVLVYPPYETGSVTITRGDMQRLEPDEFLNDTLVEYGMKRIFARLKDLNLSTFNQSHLFSSFFYKKVSTGATRTKGLLADSYRSVRKWTGKVDLFSKKYVIIPINENYHWYLAIIVNPGAMLQVPDLKIDYPFTGENGQPLNLTSTADAELPTAIERQERSASILESDAAKRDQAAAAAESRPTLRILPAEQACPVAAASACEAAGPKTQQKGRYAAPDEQQLDVQTGGLITGARPDVCYILTLDSLATSHSVVIQNLKSYLQHEALDKRQHTASDESVKAILGKTVKTLEQPNSSDCGLYVMHFTDVFLDNPEAILSKAVGTRQKTADKVLWRDHEAIGRRLALKKDIEDLSVIWRASKQPQLDAGAIGSGGNDIDNMRGVLVMANGADVDADGEESDDVEYVGAKAMSPHRNSLVKTRGKRKRMIPQGSDAEDSETATEVQTAALHQTSTGFKRSRPDKITVEIPTRPHDVVNLPHPALEVSIQDHVQSPTHLTEADQSTITVADQGDGSASVALETGDVEMLPVPAANSGLQPRSNVAVAAESASSAGSEGSEDTDSDDDFDYQVVPAIAPGNVFATTIPSPGDGQLPRIDPPNYNNDPTPEERMLVDLTVSESRPVSRGGPEETSVMNHIAVVVPHTPPKILSQKAKSLRMKPAVPIQMIGVHGDSKKPLLGTGHAPASASEWASTTLANTSMLIEIDDDEDVIQNADEMEEVLGKQPRVSKPVSPTRRANAWVTAASSSTSPLRPSGSDRQSKSLHPTSPYGKRKPLPASLSGTHTRFFDADSN